MTLCAPIFMFYVTTDKLMNHRLPKQSNSSPPFRSCSLFYKLPLHFESTGSLKQALTVSMSLLVEVTIDGSEVDSPNVARKGSNDTATGCFVFLFANLLTIQYTNLCICWHHLDRQSRFEGHLDLARGLDTWRPRIWLRAQWEGQLAHHTWLIENNVVIHFRLLIIFPFHTNKGTKLTKPFLISKYIYGQISCRS